MARMTDQQMDMEFRKVAKFLEKRLKKKKTFKKPRMDLISMAVTKFKHLSSFAVHYYCDQYLARRSPHEWGWK